MAASLTNDKQKLLAIGLAGVILFSVYSRLIASPLQKKVIEVNRQIQKSQTLLKDLKEKQPPVGEISSHVAKLEEEQKSYLSEIQSIEAKLPSRSGTSKFIAQVTELASEIKIDSVKQRIQKEDAYSRLYLEVQFSSTYSAAVRYVAALESLTPYLKVEEMSITEPKVKAGDIVGPGSPMKLVVSCLLGDSSKEVELKASKAGEDKYKEIRDLLASKAKPSTTLRESEFHIEGITYSVNNPTVIINGDVYRVGSEIGGHRVTAIGPDSVTLSDGNEEHVMNVRR